MAGCQSLEAIDQFGRDRGLALAGPLGFRRAKTPNKSALKLLGVLPLTGRVVTADAMVTHRDIGDTITDAGGDDLLAVKDNQGNRNADLEAEFAAEANGSPFGAGNSVERERRVPGETTVEVAYFITSLTRSEANAEQLLAWIRAHWEIENRLHSVRDVSLCEDACRVRTGSSPQVLAALRNTAVHVLEGVNATSQAAAMRRVAAHPNEAIRLIRQSK